MKDYETNWEDYWKNICTNEDGTLNLDQIKRELADYSFILEQVPTVYCRITNGLLSKPNYYASAVIGVYEDCFNQHVEELKDELLKEIHEEKSLLETNLLNESDCYFNGLVAAEEIIKKNM